MVGWEVGLGQWRMNAIHFNIDPTSLDSQEKRQSGIIKFIMYFLPLYSSTAQLSTMYV